MKKIKILNLLEILGIFIVTTAICYILDLFNVDVMNFMIIYVLGIMISSIIINGYYFL
mgnify:CR=1 FL=1